MKVQIVMNTRIVIKQWWLKIFFLFALIVLVFFFFSCYIAPPRFDNYDIKLFHEGSKSYIRINKNTFLHKRINEWLAKKRWCYPSLVSYSSKLILYDDFGINTENRIHSTVNIWDDRIIYQFSNGFQCVSFFFTESDKKIKKELEMYCPYPEDLLRQE